MGDIFPLAPHRSPFLCTVYTFFAPCVYGAVAGASTFATAYPFAGGAKWVYIVAVLVAGITVYGDFSRIRLSFQMGDVVTLRAMLLQLPLTAILFALITVVGCASYPFFSTWLPGKLETTQYAEAGRYIQKGAVTLSIVMAGLAATFATLFGTLRGVSGSMRGERIGTITSIREKLRRRRLKKDRDREDKILERIHRHGGTDRVNKKDIEFLERRSHLRRGQRG